VTVAETPPAEAVAFRVRHVAGVVQNQVHRFTYVKGYPWKRWDWLGERSPDG
jgi:hypothetical protein